MKPSSEKLGRARRAVESALEASEAVLEKSEDYEVHLGYAPRTSAEALDSGLVRIEFSEADQRLSGVTAAAYFRSYFLESVSPEFQWQELLRLGGSLRFAEDVTEWTAETDETGRLDIPEGVLERPASEPGDFMRRHGYTVAYEAVGRLLRIHEFSELADLELEDVEEAVEAVFD